MAVAFGLNIIGLQVLVAGKRKLHFGSTLLLPGSSTEKQAGVCRRRLPRLIPARMVRHSASSRMQGRSDAGKGRLFMADQRHRCIARRTRSPCFV
jgi:hypothetical protein